MNFDLSDDQRMLAETARAFAKKSSPVTRARELVRSQQGFDRTVWREMGELGWLGIAFPESLDGFGGSVLDVALVVEQLATTLTPEPIVESALLAGQTVLRAGNEQDHKRWLGPLIRGESVLALAHSEASSGYTSGAVETVAKRDGDCYTITGAKRWALAGQGADGFVVSALVDGDLALFVVDKDAANLEVTPVRTIDGRGACHLSLASVKVETDRRLRGGSACAALDYALDAAAACSCWEALGIASTVLTMTVDYLKTREQFGVKLGTFQVLQHRAVDMFVEVELCRSMAIAAAVSMHEDDAERKREISAAKVQLSRGGRSVVREGIQLHGGIGITEEHDIGLYFKRMQALGAVFGDELFHIERFQALPSFEPRAGVTAAGLVE